MRRNKFDNKKVFEVLLDIAEMKTIQYIEQEVFKMLSVKQTAKELDVSIQTVINWTRRGIITPEYVDPTGHRFYSEEQIKLLKKSWVQVVN